MAETFFPRGPCSTCHNFDLSCGVGVSSCSAQVATRISVVSSFNTTAAYTELDTGFNSRLGDTTTGSHLHVTRYLAAAHSAVQQRPRSHPSDGASGKPAMSNGEDGYRPAKGFQLPGSPDDINAEEKQRACVICCPSRIPCRQAATTLHRSGPSKFSQRSISILPACAQ